MLHPTDRIAHTTAFVTPVVEHWLQREIAQWVHHEEWVQMCIKLLTILLDLVSRYQECAVATLLARSVLSSYLGIGSNLQQFLNVQ